jgi:CDP-6-deoxy-D-xylo-4-hexulose-3-dehydrase
MVKTGYGKFGIDVNESNFQPLDELRKNIIEICNQLHVYKFDKKNPVIRLHEPTFSADEIIAATETLLSTRVTMGKQVKEFEAQFSRMFSSDHGVTSNSGSSANLLAIAALANKNYTSGLRPGDEVIVPAVCWSTTVWPLIQHGLIPVIVDVDIETLNIDCDAVERVIGPKTKAIMPVHVYGNPCDMDRLVQICKDNNLFLIEDCCEALGASYKNKSVGTFGDVGTFSFYFSHHISTLEGGITLTSDKQLNELMIINRAHGWVRDLPDPSFYTEKYPEIDPRFLFVDTGYNLRITEMQGAFGLVQLNKLNAFVDKRRYVTERYEQALAKNARISGQIRNSNGNSSCFGFALIANSNNDRNELEKYLTAKGIESRPIICGNIARQPALKNYEHRVCGDLKNADLVMDRGLSIGNHQHLDDDAIEYVSDSIAKFQNS